jgi:hypothetical protein
MVKVKNLKKTAKWVAPALFSPDIDRQVEIAMKEKDVRSAYKEYQGKPEDFVKSLKYHIGRENDNNYKLIKVSQYLDSFNKATVPIDTILDSLDYLGGIGLAAGGIKDLATLPGYLAYDFYYLGKTGDIAGTLKNIGYEGISWLSFGGLPHLLNHYTAQSEKYAAKKGSKEFLKNLEQRTVDFAGERKRREGLEDIAMAA